MAATFISYRRDDSAGYAGRLHEELAQRLGRDQVFRDADSLHGGEDFVHVIEERLRGCSALVALIGPNWLTARTPTGDLRLHQPDDLVATEIALALERPGVLVVPTLVGGARMPAATDLPPRIRSLARRHATTLRDETWDEDVDRLAAVLTGGGRKRKAWWRYAAIAAVPLALGALALLVRSGTVANAPSGGRSEISTRATSAAASAPVSGVASSSAGAQAIDIPALSEVVHGSLIYTLISGNVAPAANGSSVRLRFRVSNEGPYDANLWDASFRLAVGSDLLTPTSGLNEILAARSVRHATVTFNVPPNTSRAVLHVLGGNDVAELPLDLSPTGRPAGHETADAATAGSRDTTSRLLREPKPLVNTSEFSVTILGITSRLFVNKRRIDVATRMTNAGRAPIHTGSLTLRMAADDEVLAPVSLPTEVVEAGATFSANYIFDVPSGARRLELRATAGGQSAALPLEVR